MTYYIPWTRGFKISDELEITDALGKMCNLLIHLEKLKSGFIACLVCVGM